MRNKEPDIKVKLKLRLLNLYFFKLDHTIDNRNEEFSNRREPCQGQNY